MSYLDDLRKSRDKPQVAYQEFALSTRKYPNHLFCFFEGKDNSYYVSRIKRFTEDFHPIKCGGKQSVLDVYALITGRSEYKNYKLGFFIDRDFNKPIGKLEPSIFETPCYSIENLYVSVEVFKEILTHEFHLSEMSDKLFETILSLYNERQQEFHKAVLLFNSWYSCLVGKREKAGIEIGVNLADKLPREFVKISLTSVSMHHDLEKIKNTFPDAIEIDEKELEKRIRRFEGLEHHKIFRGKYELEFLLQMIKHILADSYGHKSVIKEKINFSFGDGSGLNHQQALNIFEAYAETPRSLLDYLKEVTSNGDSENEGKF